MVHALKDEKPGKKAFGRRGRLVDIVHCLLPIAGAIWFVMPVFEEPKAWGSTRDWGYFTFLEEVTRKTVLEFRQFPLWNPYYFGGSEHFANPQTTVLSPTTLLTITLGTALGLKVGILVFAVLGCWGMYRLSRHLGTPAPGASVSALIYGCSGWFAQHVGGGHWGFAAVNLYPWVVFFFLRSRERPRDLAFSALIAACVAVHWGIYTLPWLFMLILLISVGVSVRERRPAIFRRLTVFLLVTVSLAAVRLVPTLEYVEQFPRHVVHGDRLGADDLLHLFLSRHTERQFPDHVYVWPEYGNYVGWVPFLLLLVGIWVKFPHKTLLWCGFAVFVSLSLGSWGPAAPFTLLHRLPLLENLRVPSRYTLLVLFFMALIVGHAYAAILDEILKRWPGKRTTLLVQALTIMVLLTIVLDPVRFNRKQFEQSFHLPPPSDTVFPSFVQRRGDPLRMYAYPRANQGSVLGLEESPIPVSPALRIDADRQYLLTVAQGAIVEEIYWSPNELRFYVDTPVENLLVINQNYRVGWRVDGGHLVEDHLGLLTVPLGPGQHTVVLRYRPWSVRAGTMVSLLTFALLGLWVLQSERKARGAREEPSALAQHRD